MTDEGSAAGPNAVERGASAVSTATSSSHPVSRGTDAVAAKFGNDQAGGKAALIAYYGLFALFPLLLLMATVLGFVLAGLPGVAKHLLNTPHSANFPIIGAQLPSVEHSTVRAHQAHQGQHTRRCRRSS